MASTKKAPVKKAVTKAKAPHKSPARVSKTKAPPKKPKPGPKTPVPARLTPASNTAAPDYIVHGANSRALFSLTAYRGEGMCLLAMNWKIGMPSNDFVGFFIDYQEPGGAQFFSLNNRITFPEPTDAGKPEGFPTDLAPIQKFRWIHFPRNANIPGFFTYRVKPVFMNGKRAISYGDPQQVGIELEAETYPGELNICFTRGFVASQAFVRKFGTKGGVGTIIPAAANTGITFKPTDPHADEALSWMGFEAREAIFQALDASIADRSAQVRMAAYDFNIPDIKSRIEALKGRVKIIIDNSGEHKPDDSSESVAARELAQILGDDNVQRQHMGGLQHNKSLVIDGDKVKIAIGGSTNFSWRGFYVQNNNAVVLQGETAVKIFNEAFENLWNSPNKTVGFRDTDSAVWNDLKLANCNAKVTFSPHSTANAALADVGTDIKSTKSTLFYSLAFLSQTKGPVRDAIAEVVPKDIFVYGLADKQVGGLEIQLPNGNAPVVFPPKKLNEHLPPPFHDEAAGGSGVRIHHKFIVIDFNLPTARVYTGSYNFSNPADTKNGENLFLINDQRVATSYMIQAVSMFDHYEFRDLQATSEDNDKPIQLQLPPAAGSSEKPWWDKYWTNLKKKRDRELFGI